MFSFFEYKYEPNARRYTVDTSQICEFYDPLTVNCAGIGNHGGAVEGLEGHEYGPKSMSKIKNELVQQRDSNCKALIWPTNTKAE